MKSHKDHKEISLQHNPGEQLKGVCAGVGAFAFWGIMPIYWHAIAAASPPEILGHRIIWSVGVLAVLLALQGRWGEVRSSLQSKETFPLLLASSAIISCNWLLYIWAVNSGHVLDTSLGYFITPLINALLGVCILRERMRPLQTLAILIAAGGVCYQIIRHGSLPLVALSIALSFSLYGLLRKKAEVRPLPGLFVETALLFFPALGYLGYLLFSGTLVFGHQSLRLDMLLAGCGIVTSLPLMAFAYGTKRLRLATVGILQYLSPTLSFFLGLFFFGESMKPGDLLTFSLIWMAILLYSGESLAFNRRYAHDMQNMQKSPPPKKGRSQ